MTEREAIEIIKSECYVMDLLNLDRTRMINTALDVAIKALETESKPCEYMFWRIYSYINDKRLAVSPDEITPPEKRAERQVKADLLGELLDVMAEMIDSEMKCGDD